jgi:transglutaminase-like putative cysteine protease
LHWVADFLNLDGTWNEALVQQYFDDDDAEMILQIQPSRRNESYFIAWQPDKRGMFTVKSAYDFALNIKMQSQNWGATSLRPDGERPLSKIIWKNPAPPKVKLLTWKI